MAVLSKFYETLQLFLVWEPHKPLVILSQLGHYSWFNNKVQNYGSVEGYIYIEGYALMEIKLLALFISGYSSDWYYFLTYFNSREAYTSLYLAMIPNMAFSDKIMYD